MFYEPKKVTSSLSGPQFPLLQNSLVKLFLFLSPLLLIFSRLAFKDPVVQSTENLLGLFIKYLLAESMLKK